MSISRPKIFYSPGDLGDANRELGWGITYRKLTPGKYRGCFEVEKVIDCLLVVEAHNASMDVNGSNSPDMFALLNIQSFGGAMRVNGQKMDAAGQLLLSPGGELDIVSSGPCRVDQVYIPSEIYGHLDDCGYFSDCDLLAPDTLYNVDAMRMLAARESIKALTHLHGGAGSNGCDKPDQFVYSRLVGLIGSSPTASVARTGARSHQLRQLIRARHFMWNNLHNSLSIPDICHEVGSSQRTLERLFGEAFGMTPKRYLEIIRFSQVHRDLRAAKRGETSVWKVASAAGFKHPGRFSVGYAAFFGESPKRTLLESRVLDGTNY